MRQRIRNILYALFVMTISANAQMLSVNPIEAIAGGQATLTINLSEQSATTALQFCLQLPEGVEINEDGCTLGASAKSHTLDVSRLDSDDYLFVLYSLGFEAFTDGNLLTIPVSISTDATSGKGRLNTIRSSKPDGVREWHGDISFAINVSESAIKGDVNIDGHINLEDVIMIVSHILGQNLSPFNESAADLTGNGVVDIEDVTSLVNIILSGKAYGYFYFGTTEPTAENFTSLPGAVASYTSIGEAVGATVSIAEGETLYMLCPAAWMKGKHVDVEDGEGNSYDFVENTDAGTISGYVVYKTQAFNEATDAILKFNNSSAETYYWYVGQTDPSSMSSIEPLVDDNDTSSPGWRRIGDSLPTYNSSNMLWNGATNNITFGSRDYYYLALPSDSIKLYNSGGDNEMDGCTSLGTKDFDGVTYYIYKRNVKAMAFGFNIY